ncbi:6-phosphofructo-2-kinase [Spiromyces aspiralis]|uniref:6-phosphofructo-2-kinase n=1 Tax=Spiromyces aspiralis TaxID=68401 RepID=A0ACC1HK97_9FUNG|nr:6-phosphofructo-2-kinase [Spiromyces aspiralis]
MSTLTPYNGSPVPYLGSLHLPIQRYGPGSNYQEDDHKLVVVMVGLPARGKSYIVKKLKRYLSWLGFNTKIFNVGDRRRRVADDYGNGINDAGNATTMRDTHTAVPSEANAGVKARPRRHSSAFFDPNNDKARAIRNMVAMDVLDDLILWLKSGGQVAIHDATNSTILRRRAILNRLQRDPEIKVLFVESICNDQRIIDRNIKLKTNGPDYVGMDPVAAEADFRARLCNYECAYNPLGEYEEHRDVQYCKIIDVGKKVIAYNIQGYIESQCVFYLMNINLHPRIIFITRHGQSEDNVLGRIGGDANLSEKGRKFAATLTEFVKQKIAAFAERTLAEQQQEEDEERQRPLSDSIALANGHSHYPPATSSLHEYPTSSETSSVDGTPQPSLEIWTSMLKRAMQTAEGFDPDVYTIRHLRALNEIYAGKREGMTYKEIMEQYPDEFEARRKNKFYYRYPGIGGESYADVVQKLQPIIVELERKRHSVMIVGHRAVVRTLLSYLMEIPTTHMPDMEVPLGYVYACEPRPFGNHLTVWKYLEDKDCFVEIDAKSALQIRQTNLMTPPAYDQDST